MDYAQARKILDKYGEDNCMQIIFDNGRVWLTNLYELSDDPKEAMRGIPKRDENGKIVFLKFSDIVSFDEESDTVCKKTNQHGVDYKSMKTIRWDIVNPIEGIQGFNFLPQDATEQEKYIIRTQWDHTIVQFLIIITTYILTTILSIYNYFGYD